MIITSYYWGTTGRPKEKLGLSDTIVEKAAYTYRKVQERGLIRGRTIDSMLAAALYSACREMETPRLGYANGSRAGSLDSANYLIFIF
jgi:transcription initiation factor TFIIIB Brf1 subunit/transcription initiation factor TFIIB